MIPIIEYLQSGHLTNEQSVKIYSKGPAVKEIIKLFDLNKKDEVDACANSDALWDRLTEQGWSIYSISCIHRYKKEDVGSIIAEGEYWFLGDTVEKFNDESLDFNMFD